MNMVVLKLLIACASFLVIVSTFYRALPKVRQKSPHVHRILKAQNRKRSQQNLPLGPVLDAIIDVTAARGPLVIESYTCHSCQQTNWIVHPFNESFPCHSCGLSQASKAPIYAPEPE